MVKTQCHPNHPTTENKNLIWYVLMINSNSLLIVSKSQFLIVYSKFQTLIIKLIIDCNVLVVVCRMYSTIIIL